MRYHCVTRFWPSPITNREQATTLARAHHPTSYDADATAPLPRPELVSASALNDAVQFELRDQAQQQLARTVAPLVFVSTVLFVVLRSHVDPLPLALWYGVAVLDALLILLSNRYDRLYVPITFPDSTYVRSKLVHYICFGLVWGSLPLIASRWGTETGMWISLIAGLMIHGLTVLSGTPYRRLRLASLLAMMIPIGVSMAVRPEVAAALAAIAVIYCIALVRLYDVLDTTVLEATKVKHEKTALAEQLESYLNDRDPLTGLLNRRGLLHWLVRYSTIATPPADVAIGVLNIRRFSAMNDFFGVGGGDDLLIELGRRLGKLSGPVLAVARLDGDEFAIVTPNVGARDRTRILALLGGVHRTPFSINGADVELSIHVQHAVGPAADAENLLRAARGELQRARIRARTAPMSLGEHDPESHTSMVEQLRTAFTDGSLGPWFQPIVDARTGAVTAFEALVRWEHPTKGLIPPAEFLPHVEVAGLAHRLTQVVLVSSVRFVRDMMLQGRDHVPAVHINVWPSDIRRTKFVDALRRELAVTGVPGNYIVLEITESDVILLDDTLATNLRRIGDLGVQLAIDDFGTGYSSLSHLLELPVGHLKIDRGFIREFATSHKHQALVKGIISIAEGLGLGTVAEGVEAAEEVERLRELGCRQLQGYFISAALPAREALLFETDDPIFQRQGELFTDIDATPTSIIADFAPLAE